MTDATDHRLEEARRRGHEGVSVRSFALLLAAGAILALVAFALLAVRGLLPLLGGPPTGGAPITGIESPPRVIADQAAQRRELEERHEDLLQSYDWTDREANTARIPIDRAIDILAERGDLSVPASETVEGEE
ncbi:MAG: hypothetical protein ACREJB_16105 [Planctomycetaceae bacterium]